MHSDGGAQEAPTEGRTVPGIVWILIAVVLLTGTAYYFLKAPDTAGAVATTFVAQKGNLDIVVLEGGIVEARESQQIRSEVQGSSKILNIVEEGYQVTAEDVTNGKILVELDTASLRDELISDEIAAESAKEQQISAEADYEIQINQNESTLKTAELLVKFARMDFQKFLGEKPVAEILNDLGLDEESLRLEAEQRTSKILRMKSRELLESSREANPVAITTGSAPKFEDLIIDEELNQAIRAAFREKMSEGGFGGFSGGARGAGGGDRPGAGRPRGERRGAGDSGGDGPGGRGGVSRGEGGRRGMQLTPERIEQMAGMGIDIYDIARKAGKLKSEEAVVEAPKGDGSSSVVNVAMVYERPKRIVDFSKYTNVDSLEDGQALQQLRTYQDAVGLAKSANILEKTNLAGSEKLFARNFVTQLELDGQRLKVQNSDVSVKKAITDQELYIKYEFPKTAEQLLSNYEEALMAFERAQKMAASQLSQKAAKMNSAKRRFLYEKAELEETKEEIRNSVIPAKRTGLVVYGSSSGSGGRDSHRGGGTREPIMEGTAVRERQLILTIPDMTKMGVAVKVQESSIQKVAVGQKSRIRIESRPGELLEGEVVKVAVLPDANDRWMNPDKTVYNVSVRIDSVNQWLQPGATSQVEILVETLEDIVYVPIQAIAPIGKDRFLYVVDGDRLERRLVETGSFTDTFIEIKSGISAGEVVQLRMPDSLEQQSTPATDGDDGSAESGQFALN